MTVDLPGPNSGFAADEPSQRLERGELRRRGTAGLKIADQANTDAAFVEEVARPKYAEEHSRAALAVRAGLLFAPARADVDFAIAVVHAVADDEMVPQSVFPAALLVPVVHALRRCGGAGGVMHHDCAPLAAVDAAGRRPVGTAGRHRHRRGFRLRSNRDHRLLTWRRRRRTNLHERLGNRARARGLLLRRAAGQPKRDQHAGYECNPLHFAVPSRNDSVTQAGYYNGLAPLVQRALPPPTIIRAERVDEVFDLRARRFGRPEHVDHVEATRRILAVLRTQVPPRGRKQAAALFAVHGLVRRRKRGA